MPDAFGQLSRLAADLATLANERTSEKRVELLRRITDAYADRPDKHSPTEAYLFQEVISKLVDRISGADRAAASAKLATLPELPESLAQKLAADGDIDVARPILSSYGALSERSLVDVARTGSQDHLFVIAGRAVVTPPVSDVVVTRGNRKTVRKLAANQGAQFSAQGMDNLIAKAEGDGALQAAIVERPDLPLDAIGKLLPMISEELASRLRAAAIEVDHATVREHFAAWAGERRANAERTDTYIDGIRKGDLHPNDVIREIVTGGRLLDAATVLAAVLEIDRYYAFNLLTGGKVQSALLLLRAAGLSWPVVDAFIRLRIEKTGLLDYEVPPERRDYFAIDVAAAQRVVRFMKVRRVAAAS